jgi:hypothetical protein
MFILIRSNETGLFMIYNYTYIVFILYQRYTSSTLHYLCINLISVPLFCFSRIKTLDLRGKLFIANVVVPSHLFQNFSVNIVNLRWILTRKCYLFTANLARVQADRIDLFTMCVYFVTTTRIISPIWEIISDVTLVTNHLPVSSASIRHHRKVI